MFFSIRLKDLFSFERLLKGKNAVFVNKNQFAVLKEGKVSIHVINELNTD